MTQPWRDLADFNRKVYSQTGEEGVLEGIFANIGDGGRYLVDIGAGDGVALSNTRWLLEQGWHGARFDAAYAGDVHQERITAENVTEIFLKYQVPPVFDLLSLDIDGLDFWVLRALLRGGWRPRAVCLEVNPELPAEPPVAVVPHPQFTFRNSDYFGASFGAYNRLMAAYGYRLVHLQAGMNAFYVTAALVPADAVIEVEPFVPRHVWGPDPAGRAWQPLTDEECR